MLIAEAELNTTVGISDSCEMRSPARFSIFGWPQRTIEGEKLWRRKGTETEIGFSPKRPDTAATRGQPR